MGDNVIEEIRTNFPRGYIAEARRILRDGKFDDSGQLMANGTVVTAPEVVSILNNSIQLDIDATEKIGGGIDHWVVFSNRDITRNSAGYRIIRVDGTGPITFGYSDVLRPPTAKTYVQRALNDEAADLMLNFRKEQFRAGAVYCEKTGVLISGFLSSKAVHIDPTVTELHEAFLSSEGLTFDTVGLVKQGLPRGGYLLADPTFAARWVDFQGARLGGVRLQHMDRFDR